TVHCINPGICALSGTQVAISNPTEVDEYDYGASSPTKKTAQTWMTTSNGSLYDIVGGHLLDRLATRTITDPVTNVQSTLRHRSKRPESLCQLRLFGPDDSTEFPRRRTDLHLLCRCHPEYFDHNHFDQYQPQPRIKDHSRRLRPHHSNPTHLRPSRYRLHRYHS